jgi:hypothetical protein
MSEWTLVELLGGASDGRVIKVPDGAKYILRPVPPTISVNEQETPASFSETETDRYVRTGPHKMVHEPYLRSLREFGETLARQTTKGEDE